MENILLSEAGKLITEDFEKILKDPDLAQKFAKVTSLEEMFDFCQKIRNQPLNDNQESKNLSNEDLNNKESNNINNYSFEQFDNFLVASMKQISFMDKDVLRKMLLEKINGGKTENNSGINNLVANSLVNDIQNISKMMIDGKSSF